MAGALTVELDAQYRQLREEYGLLDRSDRGKLLVGGPDAAEFLQGQVTNDVEALAPGGGCYAALLDRKAHVQADMRIPRLPEPDTGSWVDTEPAALEVTRRHLDTYRIGRDVELEDVSEDRAIFALIGPATTSVASIPVLEPDESEAAVVAGVDVLAVGRE